MRNSIRRFKGGSSGPTETTVTNQNIPDWLKPQMTALLARSEFESNQPYLPYSQQRLAGFSPAERMAQRGIASMGMFGDPIPTREAQRRVSQAPDAMDSRIANAYMSPYFSQALDPLKDETRRQSAIQSRDIRDKAVGSGGLGGYREAIMQSERQRDLNRQLSDIDKAGRQDAFLDASRRFEADRDSQFQRADRLSALGAQQQTMGLERLRALQGIGEQDRAMQQASLDMGYSDFLRQQGYPQQQLGFYENILKGTYSRPNETVSTFGRSPNLFSQALGGAVSLGGLMGMAGGGRVRGGLTSLGIANAMRGLNAR